MWFYAFYLLYDVWARFVYEMYVSVKDIERFLWPWLTSVCSFISHEESIAYVCMYIHIHLCVHVSLQLCTVDAKLVHTLKYTMYITMLYTSNLSLYYFFCMAKVILPLIHGGQIIWPTSKFPREVLRKKWAWWTKENFVMSFYWVLIPRDQKRMRYIHYSSSQARERVRRDEKK